MHGSMKSFVGARFLILIAHLVIIITMFWSKEQNVISCIGRRYTNDEFNQANNYLTTLFGVTVGLFAIELGGFLFGLSMFNVSQTLLSIACHFSACITLSFFIVDQWSCYTYWYIFWFCSAFPAFTELCILLHVLCS